MYSSTLWPVTLKKDEEYWEVYPSVTGEICVSSAPRSTTIPLYLHSEYKCRLAYLTKDMLWQFSFSKQYSAIWYLKFIWSSRLWDKDGSENVILSGTPDSLSSFMGGPVLWTHPLWPPSGVFSTSTVSTSSFSLARVYGSMTILWTDMLSKSSNTSSF